MLEKMNKEDNKYKITNASGQRMDVSGGVKLWVHIENSPHPKLIHFIISRDVTETLISCQDLVHLGILHPSFPAYIQQEAEIQQAVASQEEEEEEKGED